MAQSGKSFPNFSQSLLDYLISKVSRGLVVLEADFVRIQFLSSFHMDQWNPSKRLILLVHGLLAMPFASGKPISAYRLVALPLIDNRRLANWYT